MNVEIDGLNIYVERDGEGEAVLLLHGWGGSTESFKPVYNFLSKKCDVVSLDFPGFGKSDPPKEVWGVREYGEFVLKLLNTLSIESTNIVAHSFGGRVALWLAANYAEKINMMILANSAGLKPKRKLTYYLKVSVAKVGKKILLNPVFGGYGASLLNGLYILLGSKDYQQQKGIMRSVLVKVVNEDLRNILSNIEAPVLLVWGENDKDVPLSQGREMEKRLKDAGLVIFKDAGHFSYLDKFNDFCIITARFFSLSPG